MRERVSKRPRIGRAAKRGGHGRREVEELVSLLPTQGAQDVVDSGCGVVDPARSAERGSQRSSLRRDDGRAQLTQRGHRYRSARTRPVDGERL